VLDGIICPETADLVASGGASEHELCPVKFPDRVNVQFIEMLNLIRLTGQL